MKAYLILEDGNVFEGESVGANKEVVSEFVFNTSMTGYVEVLTDPSYAGQSVVMTYPLIGNYGVCLEDQESTKPYVEGFVVNELARLGSNFRKNIDLKDYLIEHDIPCIQGIDTRHLTKIIRNKGCMNGMITTTKYDDLSEVMEKIHNFKVTGVVEKTTYIIIRFHNTDIFSRSFVQTDIHSLSITAVFLVNDHKTWIILRIFFNDFQRMICRSIVHTDNLYILQCLTLNTFQTFIQKHFHIICRYDN